VIISIKRDFNNFPNTVGITATDNLATITADSYISSQESQIELINNGEFTWEVEDIILIYYSPNQVGFFQRDVANDTFVPLSPTDTAVIPITSSQIQGMYATPIELLLPPNAGQVIIVDTIVWNITYGSAQYTSGGAIQAQWGPVNHGGGTAATATIAAATLNGVAASTILIQGPASALNTARTNVEDAGIYLTNQTGAFATGDSGAVLTIRYHIITA
jgi:hypothetical protein